jgi:Ca2+:H+ antiporter
MATLRLGKLMPLFHVGVQLTVSMEIGSAYALQVCLLQIPFMVGFSAFWDPKRMGQDVDTFK